jgi:hypothetical protein
MENKLLIKNKPIIINNFINKEDADILISEMQSPSEINPYPEYYKSRYGGTAFPYNKRTIKILRKYALKANLIHQNLNPNEKNKIKCFKAFGSMWRPGDFGDIHIDDQDPEKFIEYSSVIYLNDSFSGGNIFFPALGFEYKPEKYSAVFFISDGLKWKHGITPVQSGNRYTLLLMHTTQDQYVDPDLE